ncbi:hypothetical protein PR048_012650 [Dryococelus australis]|uniref:DDE-1 domain-containing protein n=1 Tax=Dryococelus australis TaxID=614101 RepID=A0ABQ9HPY7_9NEOP|nr:hypothetical protein PR048_012650 [Dryococelus australis]
MEYHRCYKYGNVTILCLPPHTTHKMQPLDKTLMGALKTYYNEEVHTWLRHSSILLTPFDVVELFGCTYLKVRSTAFTVNSFKATGLYPVDRNIFSSHDFLVSDERSEHAIATPEEIQTDGIVVLQCAVENDEPSSRPNLECVPSLLRSSCSNKTTH